MHATPNQHLLVAQWVRAQISMLEYSSSNPTQGTSFFFFFTYILSGSYSRPYFGHFFLGTLKKKTGRENSENYTLEIFPLYGITIYSSFIHTCLHQFQIPHVYFIYVAYQDGRFLHQNHHHERLDFQNCRLRRESYFRDQSGAL